MKALLLTQPGSPQEIVTDLMIDLPRGHEVLVRTAACGLCHSDLTFRNGQWGHPLPAVLGHECSGVVEAVGPLVDYLKPGDHVVGCLTPFCGECRFCLSGKPFICSSAAFGRAGDEPSRLSRNGESVEQFVHLSGFAELMLVHERALVRIDADIPLEVAAVVGCAVTTGVGAALNTAEVRPGETVAVIGCGGVGLNIIQGARIAGASRIVAIDRSPEKAEAARLFGATDAVTATDSVVEEIMELTSGGVDHAFEAVGRRATAELAFRMLAPGGAATVVGLLPEGEQISLSGPELMLDRRIRGSRMGSNRFRIDVPHYLDMYRSGTLLLDELISARISLEDVDQALVDLGTTTTVARSVAVFS